MVHQQLKSSKVVTRSSALAALVSGGLDSAILLGEAAARNSEVHPLYVRCGLIWEQAELEHLNEFLKALNSSAVMPLTVLELPVADLYNAHWSLTGENVPDEDSPDEAVFLPGRNVLLLAKALLWCHRQGIPELALGTLTSNPFPDATTQFFKHFQAAVNDSVGGAVIIVRPYATLTKAEVMRRGRDLPLEFSFSCIRPVAGRHCGKCNKCAERHRAFADAGLEDPTRYHEGEPCTR